MGILILNKKDYTLDHGNGLLIKTNGEVVPFLHKSDDDKIVKAIDGRYEHIYLNQIYEDTMIKSPKGRATHYLLINKDAINLDLDKNYLATILTDQIIHGNALLFEKKIIEKKTKK